AAAAAGGVRSKPKRPPALAGLLSVPTRRLLVQGAFYFSYVRLDGERFWLFVSIQFSYSCGDQRRTTYRTVYEKNTFRDVSPQNFVAPSIIQRPTAVRVLSVSSHSQLFQFAWLGCSP